MFMAFRNSATEIQIKTDTAVPLTASRGPAESQPHRLPLKLDNNDVSNADT